MKRWQIEYVKGMAGLYGKALDAVQGELVRYKDTGLLRKSYLAELGLDCYFPATGGAEIEFAIPIGDDVPDSLW